MPSQDKVRLIQDTLRTAGYDSKPRKDEEHTERLRLHYRNGPDGGIRWVWMARARKASCLRFYYQGTGRARRVAFLVDMLFRWAGERLFASGRVDLYISPSASGALMEGWGRDFALFTGTPGPNRKSVVFLRRHGKNIFLKLSQGDIADRLLENEHLALGHLQQLKLFFMQIPRIDGRGQHMLATEDLGSPDKVVNTYSIRHDVALAELYIFTQFKAVIGDCSWWQRTGAMLRELRMTQDTRLPKGMIYKLERLALSIEPGQAVPCSRAHGDFTPWNMTIREGRLHVYDWELSMEDAPALWDAFHFIFQTGVLLHRHSTERLWMDIQRLRSSILAKKVREGFGDIFDRQLHLYLLTNITYYLHLYSRQPQWHVQVSWLIRCWNEALNLVLTGEEGLTPRQLVCIDLFDHLKDEEYAALKWGDRSPESLSELSDIDICVNPAVIPVIGRFFREHPFVAGHRCQERSFVMRYAVSLKDGSLLSVDAIWQFRRKELQFLDAREMLATARMNASGVKTPGIQMDFAYTWLFYLLNHASMPEHYARWFSRQPEHLRATLQEYFRTNWDTGLEHYTAAYDNYPSLRARVEQGLRQMPCNKGWNRWRHLFRYGLDTLQDRLRGDGVIITFSGVDGAGKSTIISNVSRRLEKQFRKKVIVLRHRPSLLPILSAWKDGKAQAERQATERLPRKGGNYSRLSSLLRFGYYYTDYLFGQLYVQCRYVWCGYIVVYDRYYFDFIHDSRRSNIHLPPAFTAWFYKWLLKPRLNFFLYAPAEIILGRKQELDTATIRELTGQYLHLFETLSRRYTRSRYIPIRNIDLDDTLDTIVDHIKHSA